MASKIQIKKSIAELSKWYPKGIPPSVLAERLNMTEDEAKQWLETFATPVVKKPVVRRKKKSSDIVHSVAQHILPVGAGIIALIALGRSILFTFNYFERTDSFYSAIFMAVLFGLVGYLAPSISMLAFKSKRWFIFTGAMVAFILFSWINIYITVQELNITKVEKETTVVNNYEEVIKARARVATIPNLVDSLVESIARDKEEYQVVLAKSAVIDIPTWEYNRHRDNLAVINTRIQSKENEIKVLRQEERDLTNIEGYYTIEVLTQTDKEVARQMDVVFAVSLEVIGPLFTAIALFL